MESISGSFSLEVSDRWTGAEQPWPIAEEDECQIRIGGIVVLSGWVGRANPTIGPDETTLSLTGKDKAAALVENSVELERWTFRRVDLLALARTLAAPFGIDVHLQSGIVLDKRPRVVVSPGDTPFDVISRVARESGVLVLSDGIGGIELARTSTRRAVDSLVQGVNVHRAGGTFDAEERFARYLCLTTPPGTDTAHGQAIRVRATAQDEGVRRPDRVRVVRPPAGTSAGFAKRLTDWEARIRAARADTLSVTVVGWEQSDGSLWEINRRVTVKIPGVRASGEMLISGVSRTVDESGTFTVLTLTRPDAFEPEPRAVVKSGKGGGGAWKELAGGAR